MVHVLVAYATRYGGTAEIADWVAQRLRLAGLSVELRSVEQVETLDGYDAAVIGGALYFGHWYKPLRRFLHAHGEDLAARPTWLFSSGPLGDKTIDDKGEDPRTAAEPEELAEALSVIHPRDHIVFYGVLRPERLRLRDRIIRRLPAGHDLLPQGDFRNRDEIETWADEIAETLDHTRPSQRERRTDLPR